jgi:hypothetical protein
MLTIPVPIQRIAIVARNRRGRNGFCPDRENGRVCRLCRGAERRAHSRDTAAPQVPGPMCTDEVDDSGL